MISFFLLHVVPLPFIMIMDFDMNSYHLVMYLMLMIMLRDFLFFILLYSVPFVKVLTCLKNHTACGTYGFTSFHFKYFMSFEREPLHGSHKMAFIGMKPSDCSTLKCGYFQSYLFTLQRLPKYSLQWILIKTLHVENLNSWAWPKKRCYYSHQNNKVFDLVMAHFLRISVQVFIKFNKLFTNSAGG